MNNLKNKDLIGLKLRVKLETLINHLLKNQKKKDIQMKLFLLVKKHMKEKKKINKFN